MITLKNTKTLNCKLITSLSLLGAGLIVTQQHTTSMLRSLLTSSSKALQTVSSSLSSKLTRPTTAHCNIFLWFKWNTSYI